MSITTAEVEAVYDRAAPSYDRFRALWLRLAGSGAEAAMLADVHPRLVPGAEVLDAGCGTGALSRLMREVEPDIALTMLDLSAAMLLRAADVPGERVQGSVLELPFDDASFDLVVCAWVIETVPDPARAVRELLRVMRPGGIAVYTFCSLPDGWWSLAGSAWLREAVGRGFAGQFLPPQRTPWHDCENSHLLRFGHGLSTEVVLSDCCAVADPVLPLRASSPAAA